MAAPGPVAVEVETWLSRFENELRKLRLHIDAGTLALQMCTSNERARDLARRHDKVQKQEATLALPAKKRPR